MRKYILLQDVDALLVLEHNVEADYHDFFEVGVRDAGIEEVARNEGRNLPLVRCLC